MKVTRAIRFRLRRGVVAGAIATACFVGSRADAALIAIEDFESYAAGTNVNGLAGGVGWTGGWSAVSNHVTVVNSTLVDPNAIVTGGTKAAKIQLTAATADIVNILSRAFPSQTGTVYVGMQLRLETFEDDDFLNFQASNGAVGNVNDTLGVGVRNQAGNPFFARSGSSNAPGVTTNFGSAADATDYVIVAKYSLDGGSVDYNRADLFVNPTSTIEGAPYATAISTQPTNTALSLFNTRLLSGDLDDMVLVDSIRVATTFQEALTGTAAPTSTTQTLTAVADAHVQSGPTAGVTTDDQNFGLQTVLQVKHASDPNPDFHRKAWIAFDTTGSQLAQVDEATLKLTISGSGGSEPAPADSWTFDVYGLRDDFVPSGAELNENWLETAITYNNAPGNNIPDGGSVDLADVFGGAPLDSFTILGTGATGDMILLDDPAILNFLQTDTDGRVSFILVRRTEEFGSNSVIHQFASRQSTAGNGPQLILVTNAILPEPSVAVLGLMSLSALGLRRRRTA